MKCYPSYGGRGYCACERHSAYNASSCACQKAELCSHKVINENRSSRAGEMSEVGNCFNGMICIDASCSCRDLSSVLYEPATRFCVAPRSGDYEDDLFSRKSDNR